MEVIRNILAVIGAITIIVVAVGGGIYWIACDEMNRVMGNK